MSIFTTSKAMSRPYAAGRVHFSGWHVHTRRCTLGALRKAGVPVFAYGNFLTVAVNFIILAFIIFMMIKQINRLKREAPTEAPAAPAAPAEDIVLLREIRDSLKR